MSIKKVLNLILRLGKKEFWVIFILVLITSLSEALALAALYPVLMILTNPSEIKSQTFYSILSNELSKYQFYDERNIFILILFLSSLVISLSIFLKYKLSDKLNYYLANFQHYLNIDLLSKQLTNEYIYFISKNSSYLTNTIIVQTDKFVNLYVRNIFNIFTGLSSLMFIISLIFYINIYIPFISLFIFGLFYLILYKKIIPNVTSFSDKCLESSRDLHLYVGEVYKGIKVVKLLDNSAEFLNKVEKVSKIYKKYFHKSLLYQGLTGILTEGFVLLFIIMIVGLIICFSSDLSNVQKLLPVVGIYAVSLLRIKPHLSTIFSSFVNMKSSSASVENILNEYQYIKKYENSCEKNFNFKSKIEFRNLSFSYNSNSDKTLNNINFSITKGSFVGIVGSTGSGKTTMVDILLGLLRAKNGSLNVDDITIDSSTTRSWQSQIGYVPQEIFLTDNTIAENICFGQKLNEINSDLLKKVSQISLVSEFASRRSGGLYSLVGETGVCLSGGQRQRIGIARALYNNPSVLVLDEATSALDVSTEKKILNSLLEMRHNLTVIMITHRVSTLHSFDSIILLEKGELIFQGASKNFFKLYPQYLD